jgi:hypothetical protein
MPHTVISITAFLIAINVGKSSADATVARA